MRGEKRREGEKGQGRKEMSTSASGLDLVADDPLLHDRYNEAWDGGYDEVFPRNRYGVLMEVHA